MKKFIKYGNFGYGKLNKNTWIIANYIDNRKVFLYEIQFYLNNNFNEKFNKNRVYTIIRKLYKTGLYTIKDNKKWRFSSICRKVN